MGRIDDVDASNRAGLEVNLSLPPLAALLVMILSSLFSATTNLMWISLRLGSCEILVHEGPRSVASTSHDIPLGHFLKWFLQAVMILHEWYKLLWPSSLELLSLSCSFGSQRLQDDFFIF